MDGPLLSVVIPAYCEEVRIGTSVAAIAGYLNSMGRQFEILLIDDGSRDATIEVAVGTLREKRCGHHLRVLKNHRNMGKGYSVRRGMLEAKGRYALLTDADLSTPIEELEKLEEYVVDRSIDVAFGSRAVRGAIISARQPRYRELAGRVFNNCVSTVTGLNYKDTQCGFKLFTMASCRKLFLKQITNGYCYDVEILYIARKWGLSAVEVPVSWRHSPGTKVDVFSDASRMFYDLLRIRWNDISGQYHLEPKLGLGS